MCATPQETLLQCLRGHKVSLIEQVLSMLIYYNYSSLMGETQPLSLGMSSLMGDGK